LLGLGTGWILVQGLSQQMAATLPGVFLSGAAVIFGVIGMVAAGVVAGVFPAAKAMRLTIVDALARR
jgi:ABC-type antimicrobial peptide transport system permease subunit